jgi:hypothetical protein
MALGMSLAKNGKSGPDVSISGLFVNLLKFSLWPNRQDTVKQSIKAIRVESRNHQGCHWLGMGYLGIHLSDFNQSELHA